MKKIGLILTSEPRFGGEHQYAMLVAECLKKNAKSNYELVGICSNGLWINWCKKNHIKCKSYPWSGYDEAAKKFNYQKPLPAKIYNSFFTSMGRWLRKEKISLLFCTQQGTFVPNYFVKRIQPVHDIMHRYEGQFPEVGSPCEYNAREIVFKGVARCATTILVESKLGKKQFGESFLKGSARKPRIEVLPYVVPEHILQSEEEYMELPEKYVFYPAQFWSHKNHINLVKAIKLLKDDIEDIHLILVGSEKNNQRQIEKYISDNHLEKNIDILGFVSDQQLVYLYKHAVSLVMPTYFGPTNIPPLEAMALGCPVAVSNKYAMKEQVGKAGLLFNPDNPEEIADCIKRMWLDDALRNRMIELGYQRISKWGKNEFEDKLMKIVEANL